MDFIVSYLLHNKLKKIKSSDELKELKEEERYPIRESCSRCGQNPYLCQCQRGCQHEYDKHPSKKHYRFNPEKDNY